MKIISKGRFEAIIAYTRHPNAAGLLSKEVEWYASDDEVLLATIIIDLDEEFSAIILGRDANLKYYCVNFPISFGDIDDARKNMFFESKKILEERKSIFPHGGESNKVKNPFDLIPDKKINQYFEIVRSSPFYSSAKEIIEEITVHFNDVDKNFIEQFQTTGFDARLWELYLFAYFTEERFSIERKKDAPDFLVSNGVHKIAIEAVTVNDDSKIDVDNLTPEKVKELLENYMPLKFGNALFSKMNRENKKGKRIEQYWEMKHVKGSPLIFAIADFHAKGSMTWSSNALIHYLYGMRHNWHISDDGQLITNPVQTDFTKGNGTKINGFFSLENSENVSAVLFSASATISKFVRMGKIAGFGDSSVSVKYGGVCHNHSGLLEPNKFFFEVDDKYEESWGTGISIFHNPNALYPLSPQLFPSAAHYHLLDDGTLGWFPPTFHPYSGHIFMHSITETVTQELFDSIFTSFSTVTGKEYKFS